MFCLIGKIGCFLCGFHGVLEFYEQPRGLVGVGLQLIDTPQCVEILFYLFHPWWKLAV